MLDIATEHVFNLELFPYHSKRFAASDFMAKPSSFEYVRSLLRFALQNEKILIVRGYSQRKDNCFLRKIRQLPEFQKAMDDGWIYTNKNNGYGRVQMWMIQERIAQCGIANATRPNRLEDYLQSVAK